MKKLLLALAVIIIYTSCSDTKEKAKKTIKSGGEIVGKTVGEFGKGISEGVEETFKTSITVSGDLLQKGLELGKIILSSDEDATDNVLNVYIIFNFIDLFRF